MKCYVCNKDASATCKFCGAGLCKEHVKASRYVSGVALTGSVLGRPITESYNYVVVDNAIWCGRCSVHLYRKE